MLKRKPMFQPRPQRDPAEFASWSPKARPVAASAGMPVVSLLQPVDEPPIKPVPKIQQPHDQRIRDSARGEECQVRIVGACTGNTEHTIWSHAPLQAAGKGRGWKAVDLAGAYCCTACDAVIDGQRPLPAGASRDGVLLDWFMGHMRSLVILKQKGLA